VLCFFCLSFVRAQVSAKECASMREGVFVYGSSTDDIKIHFLGSKHVEMHNGGKQFIKSDIEWVSDCEYQLILEEITVADFPFKKGDIMRVRILKMEGPEINYLSTANGRSWEGRMLKIDQ
jgi:hypothetical protein